jgi:hypothetical protein
MNWHFQTLAGTEQSSSCCRNLHSQSHVTICPDAATLSTSQTSTAHCYANIMGSQSPSREAVERAGQPASITRVWSRSRHEPLDNYLLTGKQPSIVTTLVCSRPSDACGGAFPLDLQSVKTRDCGANTEVTVCNSSLLSSLSPSLDVLPVASTVCCVKNFHSRCVLDSNQLEPSAWKTSALTFIEYLAELFVLCAALTLFSSHRESLARDLR